MRLLDVFLQVKTNDICAVYEYCPSDLQKGEGGREPSDI